METGIGVERTKAPLVDAEATDETDEIRVYYLPSRGVGPMPSVTTIEALREDPEKADALEGWRDRYDGQSKWARPWYEDQMAYKAARGTLVHFAILSALGDAAGDTYEHRVGDDDWGREEYEAEYTLKKWSLKAPSANSDDVPYTPRRNRYDGEHAWDRCLREMRWATAAFKEQVYDAGRVGDAEILGVEEYIVDPEYGYGGQYDLLYETADGTVVLSDIKTSSAIRFDHKLQGAAYKRAIESATELTIDETEVIRLHPDSETVEVGRSPEWDRSLDGLAHEFLGLADQARVAYQETLAQARERLVSESSVSTGE